MNAEDLIMGLLPILLLIGGVFCVYSAWKDYDWFMESRKARAMSNLFGRKGARVFYLVLGGIITTIGFVLTAMFLLGSAKVLLA